MANPPMTTADVTCPYCGADGYDNVVLVSGDPIDAARCGSCWGDVRTETIDRLFATRAAPEVERLRAKANHAAMTGDPDDAWAVVEAVNALET